MSDLFQFKFSWLIAHRLAEARTADAKVALDAISKAQIQVGKLSPG